MTPVYERLFEIFYDSAGGGTKTEQEMEEFFNDLAKQLVIWGSPAVINSFTAWKSSVAPEGSVASIEATFGFEELLLALRADLGRHNDGLEKGDLLRVFVNDIDDYLPQAPPGH